MNNNPDNIKKTAHFYGVDYFDAETSTIVESRPDDLYHFKTFIGSNHITVEKGDSLFYLSEDKTTAHIKCGPDSTTSQHIATIIRGYTPEEKSSTITKKTSLPYVNGCSTKQIFPPERPGDPTLQLLDIPPYSSEQAHHIHSTARVVYILSGTGNCIVGMGENCITEELHPGKSLILQKMCPHHFETDGDHLLVLPLHIFSSVGNLENNHPMYHGTYLTG
ncbi:MAG TPA: cupin domain-containing protein [Gammaproteobacteria bacterium]|nr:cupin domain-containing protein [Gammaproteobacteria bacterium]